MNTKNIYLFVFDTPENFESSKQFLGQPGVNFKDIICVDTYTTFKQEFDKRDDDDHIFLAVHVFFTEGISGIRRFAASSVLKNYKIGYAYISDGDANTIKKEMTDRGFDFAHIYKYHEVEANLDEDKFTAYTKQEILQLAQKNTIANLPLNGHPQFQYAIITALYKDEFQELEKIFDFPADETIKTDTKHYHVGYLKSNRQKKVIASFATAAGMIDSAIIATQMLEFFRPEFLVMTGVCGGSVDYNFGDVIIASPIFAYQKGKVSDILTVNADKKKIKINLYDQNQQIVDYEHLYDQEGNQVVISVERFTPDNDAACELAIGIIDVLNPKLESIRQKMNANINSTFVFAQEKHIKVEIAPMACSTMVINKEGYFEDTIKTINRKTAAVEMESFGVARACKFANGGKTKFLIFKSVMDHTFNKSDNVDGVNWKKFAAYTSAQFLYHLLNDNII
ncbi:5'-methylthioadenosine/S-adenosylhomocysteine nucleosidase [Mucilaginibacter sp. HC2]|uniref:5'-methylthioadenosine/S-adenosylhomocysteine nucleosidase family protein n=2 Tax=Bacteria TaxID=2 RepID=UPI00140DD98B|nr:5'-methylthioadenosine/S-adenosylhomocysteine nucleosidase [Mucilaginibacter inviolabilis]NHA03290.1 5'-methylthioadenosine/S-adenosylhomocysteine nucleosidase [Mucilaginibacter inviolabilis]